MSTPSFPTVAGDVLPWVTVAQMREVDRLMIEEVGITLEQMMENAGRALAHVAVALLGGAGGKRIVVLAGRGGNGGGGLVAARRLAINGAAVEVWLSAPDEELTAVTQHQLAIIRAIGVGAHVGPPPATMPADLVVDAVLGYGQVGAPHGSTLEMIQWSQGRRTVALDVPSGVELERGVVHSPHVKAAATLTLAAPKQALRSGGAARAAGRLLVADISVPPAVYERLGIEYHSPFAYKDVVELAPLFA